MERRARMALSSLLLALLTLVMWSFLALLGTWLRHLPPFLVVGGALLVGGLVGLPWLRAWRVPLRTLAVGVGGLFGYHFLYFSAFRLAPAVEANLMNYLWPLLIVLLTPVVLPGTRLRPHHVVGATGGLLGAGLLISGGRLNPELVHLPGYLAMAGAALTWALYSLLTKRLPPFPSAAVGAFCIAGGLLSLGAHALGGQAPTAPLTGRDLALIALAGLGPMGAAFYTWDAALKRGDPRAIGALSYLTPMSSTILLVTVGGQRLTPLAAAAMGLIVGGAALGSLDLFGEIARSARARARTSSPRH